MEVQNQVSQLALSLVTAATSQAISIVVAQKAMEAQAAAMSSGTNLPAHLGQNVNTTA